MPARRRQRGIVFLPLALCTAACIALGVAGSVVIHIAALVLGQKPGVVQIPTPLSDRIVNIRLQSTADTSAHPTDFSPAAGTTAPTGVSYLVGGSNAASPFASSSYATAAQNWLDIRSCAMSGVAAGCVSPPWDYTGAGDTRVVAFYAAAAASGTWDSAKASVDAWIAAGRPFNPYSNGSRRFVLLTATPTGGTDKVLGGDGSTKVASESFSLTAIHQCQAGYQYDPAFASCIPTAPGPDGKCDVYWSQSSGYYRNMFDEDCADVATQITVTAPSSGNGNTASVTVTQPDGSSVTASAPTASGADPNFTLTERIPTGSNTVVYTAVNGPNGVTGTTTQVSPGTGTTAGTPVTPTMTTPGPGSCGAPGYPPCAVTITNPEGGSSACGGPGQPACVNTTDFGPGSGTPESLPSTRQPGAGDSVLESISVTGMPVSSSCPGALVIDPGVEIVGEPLVFDDQGILCEVISPFESTIRTLSVICAWLAALFIVLREGN